MIAQSDQFNAALLESMDEAIRSLLSQDVVDAFHSNLRDRRSIKTEEIPDNLLTVSAVLRRYFGPSARTIEDAIARRLYSRCGLEFQSNMAYELADYVRIARSELKGAPSIEEEPEATMPRGRLALMEDFDRLLVESVREAIEGSLGKSQAELAFRILEHDVTFDMLPNHLPIFYSALNRMFGKDSGTMEMAIARRLYEKLSLEFLETPNTGLARYIEKAIIKLKQREQQGFSISIKKGT
jgi:hypothetical protein